MKKFLFTVASLALAASALSARELTPDEALGRLSGDVRKARGVNASTELIYTQPDSLGVPAAYVFANGEGLLVVSADDVALPLLGYTDAPAAAGELPPNMLAWLGGYAREIAAARACGMKASTQSLRAAAADRAAIDPLVKSTWNQGAPYNTYCPTVAGTPCPTGCLATAMAQVMNYHQWPPVGTGNIDYYTETHNIHIQCNIGSYTLDWANMRNSYAGISSSASKTAVARLMQVVGASLGMDYDPQGSGAIARAATEALVNNFKYDSAVALYYRDWFSYDDWQDIVYSELENERPVIYCGSGPGGGHAFVCDGYSSDGYYHINWGWGGVSDGYFLLNALAPYDQGIGGSNEHYNDGQSIQVGVCRQNDNPVYRCVYTDLTPSVSFAKGGESIEFYDSGCYPLQKILSGTGLSVRYVLNNLVTEEQVAAMSTYINNYVGGRDVLQGFVTPGFTWPSGVADGAYRIIPQSKVGNGEWTDMAFPQQNANCLLYAEVKSGTATFTHTKPEVVEPEPEPEPLAVTATVATSIYVDAPYKLQIRAVNPAVEDYAGDVCAAFYNAAGTPVSIGATMSLSVPAGQTAEAEYESMFEWYADNGYFPGKYTLQILDLETMEPLGEGTPVEVNAGSPMINVKAWSIPSADNVAIDDFKVNLSLECTDGIYARPVNFSLYDSYGTPLTTISSEPIRLEQGQTQDYEFSLEFPYSDSNKSYKVMPCCAYSSKNLADPIDITVLKTSAIDAVESADEVVRRIDMLGRPAGKGSKFYIEVRRSGAAKIVE